MFCNDILADVNEDNENQEVPVTFCTINKSLQILETFAESSRKRLAQFSSDHFFKFPGWWKLGLVVKSRKKYFNLFFFQLTFTEKTAWLND